ncbi:hypothetical protein H5410_000301 [Solanum commersonii]|uniref:Uncharacterized protein n=1 Tax=Solanum commersonii TaxID=4109 RepID=A0A9J6AVR7_SOLCO|nr:hypothetical protein H5410_000301 [Solanum commersonii]
MSFVESAQTILGVGPTFHRSNLQMEIPPSPLSPKYRFQLDSIYVQIRCFKRLTSREFRGESSGDLGSERRLRLSELEQRDRLRVGYGFLS